MARTALNAFMYRGSEKWTPPWRPPGTGRREGKALADSRLVAEKLGKDHRKVVRSIESLLERLNLMDEPTGQKWPMAFAERRIAHPTVR